MKHGFFRVATASPTVTVAGCFKNAARMEAFIREADQERVQLLVFPELSVTGYTCLDLFASQKLIEAAEKALMYLKKATVGSDILVVAGVPLAAGNQLANAAVVMQRGKILGVVPKSYIPNYREFQERRWFTPARELRAREITFGKQSCIMANNLLFCSGEVKIAIEICEDLWAPIPPSSVMAMAGANVICNLSASNELVGKHAYRRQLVAQQSGRCIAAYIYANAGIGESSTDLVYAGGGIIAENGTVIKEAKPFDKEAGKLVVTEIDVQNLMNERRVNQSFMQGADDFAREEPIVVPFKAMTIPDSTPLKRKIDPHPFVPSGTALEERCREIFNMLASALARRLDHTGAQAAVIGLSGGLDSTLALLVTCLAFEKTEKRMKEIVAVTMPGFGTTKRTYLNAVRLADGLKAHLREIPISDACLMHFDDIGHDPQVRNIVYENAQARERTQILMDVANQSQGIVVGTGDLSELALGWATFNGDHISMYGVNSGVPKTLVKHLVEWYAGSVAEPEVRDVLLDITNTPISPELLPPEVGGMISQKTESLVGPYELHDFFLYHTLRFGSTPEKILYMATSAFEGVYGKEEISVWLGVFLKRFFSQQYKRNCLPDGPKIGSVSLSPRGDWRMASDASPVHWLEINKGYNKT